MPLQSESWQAKTTAKVADIEAEIPGEWILSEAEL